MAHSAELSPLQKDRVNRILTNLISNTHTLLSSEFNNKKQQPVQIHLHTIQNPSYFLQSNFGFSRFILGKPIYKIHINPVIFERNIPEDALEAILAHELVHTEDYRKHSSFGILKIGTKVLFKNSRIIYERQTDLKTILKGFAKGLISYRKWQYQYLSGTDLMIKKREYLTPQEIECIEKTRYETPELIKKWLKGKPIICLDKL